MIIRWAGISGGSLGLCVPEVNRGLAGAGDPRDPAPSVVACTGGHHGRERDPRRHQLLPPRQKVRYDGGHKLDRFLRDTLGAFVEWVPVCPEVECGLPVPREAMRLVGDPAAPRLVTTAPAWTTPRG